MTILDPCQYQLNLSPTTRIRYALPIIIRRVARIGRVSHLHAAAFIEANCIGPDGIP